MENINLENAIIHRREEYSCKKIEHFFQDVYYKGVNKSGDVAYLQMVVYNFGYHDYDAHDNGYEEYCLADIPNGAKIYNTMYQDNHKCVMYFTPPPIELINL